MKTRITRIVRNSEHKMIKPLCRELEIIAPTALDAIQKASKGFDLKHTLKKPDGTYFITCHVY